MRLIDADVLKLELRKYQIESLIEHSEEKNVFDVINEQPTAFDREKVVAELKEEREYSYADFEEYVNEKSPCLDAEYDDYFHRGLERAIKLVKRGGVE